MDCHKTTSRNDRLAQGRASTVHVEKFQKYSHRTWSLAPFEFWGLLENKLNESEDCNSKWWDNYNAFDDVLFPQEAEIASVLFFLDWGLFDGAIYHLDIVWITYFSRC